MTTTQIPTEEEVLGYMTSLSNWGRWGADDELGTLNLITPEKRAQAAGLVALADTDYLTRARHSVNQSKRFLIDQLTSLEFTVLPLNKLRNAATGAG